MTNSSQSIEVRYGWVIIAASLVIHTIGLAAQYILFVGLKPIADEFGWARAVPSFAYSLLMFGSGVGGLAMGWWMDKRGVMAPVLFGSVMIACGALLASRAEGITSLYVANGLLIGLLGKAAMIAPLMANATRWFDRRRGLAVAILASGQGIAGFVWLPLVTSLNDSIGWRDTYLYFGIFAFVTMAPLTILLRPRPPVAPVGSMGGATASSTTRLKLNADVAQGVMWLAVIGCCVGMAVPIVHLISHATDLGYSSGQASQVLTVLFTAAIFSRIGFGAMADRLGATVTLMLGSCCQGAVLLLFAVVDSLTGLYVAALLFGIGFAGIMPCYPLLIRVLFPVTQVGWRVAAQYLFAAGGMAFGGWLGGAIFDAAGSYKYAFLTAFAFTAFNLVMVTLLHFGRSRGSTENTVPA
ncbi:MAG: MFS transporter [Chromatiales bacterium]|nr:MFS transporter [Chromatiales bacterium]